MVSTDDIEIADISKEIGATVPFMRPDHLATDKSPTIDTVIHVLEEYNKIGVEFDAVCILQPTNPLRTSSMIIKCLKKFIKSESDSLITVRSVPHTYNPHWVFESNKQGFLKIATGENKIIPRRQELPPAYYRDGAVYLVKTSVILNSQSLYGNKISYVLSNAWKHVNIDTQEDWNEAIRTLKEAR